MKYFIIAGEASGDIHAAEFVKQLRAKDPEAQFVGLGGDCMLKQGVQLFQHYRNMAFMGVIAVLRHAKQIKENFRIAEEALSREQPDQLILVDYPSFNLKMAQFARTHLPHIKIVYYIPPKVWAWKTHRIHKIARLCDEVLAIFPFEPEFYAKFGYRCTYVGNPTFRAIESYTSQRESADQSSDTPNSLVLVPGSRRGEIANCLPKMLIAAREAKQKGQIDAIIVTAAPTIEDAFYAKYLHAGEQLTRDTWDAVSKAKAAIVTSGTACLEVALLGCPQFVVYRIYTSHWLGWLEPFIFKIRFYTLPNIICGRQIIYEAVGPKFKNRIIRRELQRLLADEAYVQKMQADYADLHARLRYPF